MSYFDDYVADGLCCERCGEFMGGDEPGFVRVCAGCEPEGSSEDVPPRIQPRRRQRHKKGRR